MNTELDTPAVLEHGELPEYRRIAPLAVVAALLGVVSLIAVVGHWLVVLAIAGIVVALVAIRRIASDSGLSGRGAAVFGLALSLLSLCWVSSHVYARSARLNREAREFTTAWLQLLQRGKPFEAYEWRRHHSERHAHGVDLVEAYGDDTIFLEEFYQDTPIDPFGDNASTIEFEYLGSGGARSLGPDTDEITQRYRLEIDTPEGRVTRVMVVAAKREVTYDGDIEWHVTRFAPDDA